MKNRIPAGTGLIPFLGAVTQQRNIEKATILDAIQQAAQELYNAGTVAVGDIANTGDTMALKQQSPLHIYTFTEVIGFTAEKAAERFAFAQHTAQQFAGIDQSAMPLRQHALVPHAPYSVSKQLFQHINAAAMGKTITIHNQECAAEDELYHYGTGAFHELYAQLNIDTKFFQPTGTSSLQTYLPLLNKAANIILVHNTYTTANDIAFAQAITAQNNQSLFWCLCPNANLYIENRLPPIDLLVKDNTAIVVGTDSYASNYTLNILEELKQLQKNTTCPITTAQLLQWATSNGAKALQMEEMLGSFSPNKQPGIVLIEHSAGIDLGNDATARRIL